MSDALKAIYLTHQLDRHTLQQAKLWGLDEGKIVPLLNELHDLHEPPSESLQRLLRDIHVSVAGWTKLHEEADELLARVNAPPMERLLMGHPGPMPMITLPAFKRNLDFHYMGIMDRLLKVSA